MTRVSIFAFCNAGILKLRQHKGRKQDKCFHTIDGCVHSQYVTKLFDKTKIISLYSFSNKKTVVNLMLSTNYTYLVAKTIMGSFSKNHGKGDKVTNCKWNDRHSAKPKP